MGMHTEGAYRRIAEIADPGSFTEWFSNLQTRNLMHVEGYMEKIQTVREKTGLTESVVTGKAQIAGVDAALCVCDTAFFMGSMGRVMGERIARTVEKAAELSIAVIILCCSGGARMQEGIFSLMQMEKTAAALCAHSDKGLLSITVLTHPTTGGVLASFASLGDIVLAEDKAMIGFAGPRVIRQTIGRELPEGFQTASFQLEHGMVDAVVSREKIRDMVQRLLFMHKAYKDPGQKEKIIFVSKEEAGECREQKHMSAWERIRAIRGTIRPCALDYISRVFEDFLELKGDRLYGNDLSVVGGIALFDGQPVTVIAQHRGREAEEMRQCNYGMPMPEGYRKALRLMKQAEKFERPIITFVNTPGAFPGIEAEERGQGAAIARNLFEMSHIKVPILSILIGEGGSGGALALAVGNEVWMLEHAVYSVISPEGYASIIWKDPARAAEAASKMHITAEELRDMGIIETIIPEYGAASPETVDRISDYLKREIRRFLLSMSGKTPGEIVQKRYERFRRM